MSTKAKIFAGLVAVVLLGAVVVPAVQAATLEELQNQMRTLCQSYYSLTGQVLSGCESYISQQQTGLPSACQGVTFTRTLKLGSRGNDVKCLQALLNLDPQTQVATSGAGSPGNETTYYGSKTVAAVKKYQTKNGLSAVGQVGPQTRAKLTAQMVALAGGAGAGGGQQQPQVGAPLTVALASDTPQAGNILIGEANKVVTKITFNGSNDADVTITGLKVKSFGTADLNNRDIAIVKIYDGTKQVGLNQALVNGYAYFTFAPAISIPKGGSKTLSIVVSMQTAGAGTATPSATVKMGIEKATDISASTTFTGTFPIVGNTFTEVAGGALGTLNVAAGTPIPVNAVNVGQKDVVLGNLIVSAGTNEDVNLTQIVVQNSGAGSTVQDTDIVNVRVKVDGVVQGTSSGFTTRRAVIDFTTPVLITKGTSKNIQIIGDIVQGAGRAVLLNIPVDGVAGVGVTSGAGIGAPNQGFDLPAINLIQIGAGQLSVAVSTASPQGQDADVIRSTTAQVLGVYDIRAIGEDILVNRIGVRIGTFNADNPNIGGTISSVGLYDENGALLSNLVDLVDGGATDWDQANPALNTFVLNWTIPANTTKKLYIKGVTNGITFAGGANNVAIHCQLDDVDAGTAGVQSIVATGLSSSGQEGPNNITSNSQLALPNITINASAQYAVVGDPVQTPRNQAVLGPSAQVLLGTMRVTASREDQNLRALSLAATTSAGNFNTYVSSVALYDGDTQITNWVVPVNNDVVFNPQDIIVPTTFVLNTPKTIKIVGNIMTPPAEGTTIRLSIGLTAGSCDGNTATLDCLQTVGKTSGQITENAGAAAIDLRVNSGGLGANTGGTLTVYSSVMWAKKNASSPSGTINRDSRATLATWDFGAVGTDDLEIQSITFTSLTGGLNNATHTDFMLYDELTGQYLANAADAASNIAGNQVTFSTAGGGLTGDIPVTRATGARLSLKANTTNANTFPRGTQIQMTIRQANDVDAEVIGTPTNRGIGITSSTTISIPADANIVRIPE